MVEEGAGTDFPRWLTGDVASAPMAPLRMEPTVSGLPCGKKTFALFPRISTT